MSSGVSTSEPTGGETGSDTRRALALCGVLAPISFAVVFFLGAIASMDILSRRFSCFERCDRFRHVSSAYAPQNASQKALQERSAP